MSTFSNVMDDDISLSSQFLTKLSSLENEIFVRGHP